LPEGQSTDPRLALCILVPLVSEAARDLISYKATCSSPQGICDFWELPQGKGCQAVPLSFACPEDWWKR